MPNLLVFQQLVILYLGGILVREVSEIVWRNTQECARKTKTRDWISWVTRSWSVRHARNANSWSVMLVGALQDKIGQLAILLSRGWNSQLSQAVSQTYFEKPDLSHSILTLVYIYPLYPWKKESFQSEFWERNPREKQNWFIHSLYIRDSSNSSILFLSIVKSLRGFLPKLFLTISITVRGLFSVLGSS